MSQLDIFGHTAAGEAVQRVILKHDALRAEIITLGAAVRDLRLAGHAAPLVLGLNSVADYETHGMYFGAIVGRVANRIADARVHILNHPYALTPNDHGNILHGGPVGFSSRVWSIDEVSENAVTLGLESPDGDMGFPGAVSARCSYTLGEDGALGIVLTARTDADTFCALAQHSYFNLFDGGLTTLDGHHLSIEAANYLLVNESNIPIGGPDPVEGTGFDFRAARPIGAGPVDHNYCLSDKRGPLRPAARLSHPVSGVSMIVATSEPGLQVYTADAIETGLIGLDQISYGPRSGLALETQVWPDAPNRPDFPSAFLTPGAVLRQETVYQFGLGETEA